MSQQDSGSSTTQLNYAKYTNQQLTATDLVLVIISSDGFTDVGQRIQTVSWLAAAQLAPQPAETCQPITSRRCHHRLERHETKTVEREKFLEEIHCGRVYCRAPPTSGVQQRLQLLHADSTAADQTSWELLGVGARPRLAVGERHPRTWRQRRERQRGRDATQSDTPRTLIPSLLRINFIKQSYFFENGSKYLANQALISILSGLDNVGLSNDWRMLAGGRRGHLIGCRAFISLPQSSCSYTCSFEPTTFLL